MQSIRSKLYVPVHLFVVQIGYGTTFASYKIKLMHLFATYTLNLHVLLNLFAACQRCITIFKSYILYTSTSICKLYFDVIHLSKYICSLSKMQNNLCKIHDETNQDRPWLKNQNIYKMQAGQRLTINCFLSSFAFFFSFLNFFYRRHICDN